MNPTPGPWRAHLFSAPTGGDDFTCEGQIIARVAGKDVVIAHVEERDNQEANAYLVAAAPSLLKEIQETRERLSALLKIEKYRKDDELAIALATMEMDLNRVVAIADASWPGVRAS